MVKIYSKASPVLMPLLAISVLIYFATANTQRNQPSNNVQSSPSYFGGIPNMHGEPTTLGLRGRGGRRCCRGAKGDRGRPGKPGPRGPPGIKGPAGANGQDGAKGEPGALGDPGQKGEKGDSGGSIGVMPFKNWKECAWKNVDDTKNHGVIKDCVFTKKFSDTSLHVAWTGGFRVYGCTGCCKRWYFTFDGAECSAPLPIDGIVYLGSVKSLDPFRVRHIEGHCNSIHKGKVRVGFSVGNCHGYGEADAFTGWNSVSRIFVEEVPKPQA